MRRWLLGSIFMLTIAATAFISDRSLAGNHNSREKPLTWLSEYNFFTGDVAELRPGPRVIPYTLNTPLFSDYAHKARFIYLPLDSNLTWQEQEVLTMPIGTVLIKNFFYFNDERDPSAGRRLIETRLLKHTADRGWVAWPYIWNEDQTDAKYKPLGTKTDVAWIDENGAKQELEYASPNQFECKSCHSFNGELQPIGPTVRQLHSPNQDQLLSWAQSGLLLGTPADTTTWQVMDWKAENIVLKDAARAYLDANCGYCHRPEGQASTSGLFLHYSYATGPQTGVRKSPVAAGKGSGGLKFDILPGKPDKSILYYRMLSDDPAVRMPEVGRSVQHTEGLALVRAWIEDMK